MQRRTWAAVAVLTIGLGIGPGAREARAEDIEEDRITRLERLLELQAAELERLHARLEELEEPQESAPGAAPAPPAATPPPPPPERRPRVTSTTPGKGDVARLLGDPEVGPAELDATLNRLARRREEVGMDPLFEAPPGVRLGGYLTLEYIAPSDRNSWFDLHRFVLQVDAVVADRVDLVAEIEYEHGGIGGGADGDVEIEFAEVAFRPCDAFQPKLGALLIPFGHWNLYHDDPFNDFTLRPWVGRYFVPTGFGQPGIGVEGAFQVGCEGVLTYDVALTNGFSDGFTTSGGVRGSRQAWDEDNNENKQVWGRVAYDPGRSFLDRLEVGASGTWGLYDDDDDHQIVGWGVDVLARKGPFEIQGEYIGYDLERDPAAPDTDPRRMHGVLLQGAYHFFPPFLCGCGAPFVTDTSHFTLALRYQWQDLNDRLHGGHFNDDVESWTIGLNYRITEATVFRVDHAWILPTEGEDKREFTASFSTWF